MLPVLVPLDALYTAARSRADLLFNMRERWQELGQIQFSAYFNSRSRKIKSVSFSPDSQFLLSASENAGVTLWNLDLDNLLKQGCDRLRDYLKHNPTVQPRDRAICN